jgi:hypothetical protein
MLLKEIVNVRTLGDSGKFMTSWASEIRIGYLPLIKGEISTMPGPAYASPRCILQYHYRPLAFMVSRAAARKPVVCPRTVAHSVRFDWYLFSNLSLTSVYIAAS